MPLGALLGLGSTLLGSFMDRENAQDAAQATRPRPYATRGPAGGMTVRGNQLALRQANNPFSGIFEALGLNSLRGLGRRGDRFLYGADPELADAYRGLFGQGLEEGTQRNLDLLRQMAAPEENRTRLGLEEGLFSRGQSGTTGGAERFRALEEVIANADLQRQGTALDLARREGLDRFTGALQGVGQGMGAQRQDLDVGMTAFGGLQQLLQNLFQQSGLGITAGGAQAPAAAMAAGNAATAPWTAGLNFLQGSGVFDRIGQMIQPRTVYAGGGVPMIPQPNLGPIQF